MQTEQAVEGLMIRQGQTPAQGLIVLQARAIKQYKHMVRKHCHRSQGYEQANQRIKQDWVCVRVPVWGQTQTAPD